MNNDINLLHTKKRSVLQDLTTKLRILRFGSLLLLSIVVLLSVALFLLVIASPLPALKEEEDVLLSTLSLEHATIAQHTLLTTRLNESRSILIKRMKMKEAVALFREDLPDDVLLQSLEIEENVVKLRAKSHSLEQLDIYLGALLSQVEEAKTIKEIQMNSLSLADDGYQLDITATLL